MSWGIFASNMKRYMSYSYWCWYTSAFIKNLQWNMMPCIRRGIQGINLCSIQKGNTELMEALTTVSFVKMFYLQNQVNHYQHHQYLKN